ncbi:N-acetylglucosamine kinase-like BadF-type ATPase [Streptosporangium becharense]|uniref:N-acetylglucosamine kinase-like BadF-type ATPase n=1 Tax=Streptosporangium becharense TaxID=1816182 RepID=A0A7W9MET4_9ACTN|nr:BadF/BadG/BcrA/BcrD ATPase family protein [Streptosporangium becharense]MBB2913715.1 N-acetylglucosamine kinase-like BadF-type ATPase [Streptosporangium becharense]MBB5817796.1 N-acetylglucosamine kinase-like BadF-type ATPase [Streptosporangium becharense]
MRTILAVDGGNSKTDVVLLAEDGAVVATGRGGGFRPQAEGVTAAVDVLAEAVRSALGPQAAPPYADRVAAYVAGADLPVEEEAIRAEIVSRGYGTDVVVGNDTFALLRAGASGPAGVAVVCGAGINAVGVSPTGEVARFPALGRITGDWGGGAGLGEEALWHAVRAEDGRGPATALAPAVRDHFGTATVEEVSLGIHFGELSYGRLNELAPVLMAVAAGGDPVARAIMERLADEVVVLAEVALRRLNLLGTPMEVVLGGGVLTARDPLLDGLLERRFAGRVPHAKLVVADAPPVMGAALLGLEALGAPQESLARLRAHYLALA